MLSFTILSFIHPSLFTAFMSDIIIKAENLGKKYTIGHQAERGNYMALRDVLMQNARTSGTRPKTWQRESPSFRATQWKKCGRSRM
jgi:lipopolysaccharide transport system ATP-binding protein